MMTFDRFPSKEAAIKFGVQVILRYTIPFYYFSTQEESNEIDPVPCDLTPPIIKLLERADYEIEEEIRKLVTEFGGEFAGT